MSRPDLDIPELHQALTAAARQRPRDGASRAWALRPRTPWAPAVRARAVGVLCVVAVALAGVFAVASPATTPDPGAPIAGTPAPTGDRSAAPARPAGAGAADPAGTPDAGLLRCALASIPESVLPATVVIRGAGSC